jgi:LuxR family maltose regulon positive regulatory protein
MAGKTASIAKITRPVLAGSYPRKRLFRLIDRARKRKVVWIAGPPGSGKTTLASSYVADRRAPCLWIRLEEGDADPATFFHYLGLAAKKAAPRVGKPLPMLTPDQHPAVPIFAQRYFEALFSRLESGSVIVFDDYQKIPADSAFHAMVRDRLSLLPPGFSVVLISREQPPPVFARLRASQAMGVIGWKDLRLSPLETEGSARLRGTRKGGRETIRSLYGISDGWAAGFVLLLEKAEEGSPLKLPRQKPQEILDYFAGEILENLDEEMHSFLLKSAHLPRMTPRMTEQLTGLRRAGKILATLNRRNYFTQVFPGAEPVYEYHPLFRDFLKSRADDMFSEKYIRRLRAKAAAIMESSGYFEEAAGIFREIGDWNGLSRIVQKLAPPLVRQGREGTLAEWLEFLPGEILEEDPWLLYWRGMARLSSRPGESQDDFKEAFRRFSRQKDRNGSFLAWAGVVDAIIYGPGSLKTLDPWFSTLDKMLRKSTHSLPEEIETKATCAMIKALSLRRPPFIDMGMWADRAMRLARSTRDVSLRFTSLLNVAYYRFHSGDFQEMGLLLDSLRELERRPEISPLSRLTLCWLEAAYANVNGRHDRCRKVVAEGIELADTTGVHLMDYLLSGHGKRPFTIALRPGKRCTGRTGPRHCFIRTGASPCARRWAIPGPKHWFSCREPSSSTRRDRRKKQTAISSGRFGWAKSAGCISSVSPVFWRRLTSPWFGGTRQPVLRPSGKDCASGGTRAISMSTCGVPGCWRQSQRKRWKMGSRRGMSATSSGETPLSPTSLFRAWRTGRGRSHSIRLERSNFSRRGSPSRFHGKSSTNPF